MLYGDVPAALGIDIGASKIAVGLVDHRASVVRRAHVATPAGAGAEGILAAAVRLARDVRGDDPITAVGIGSAGVIADGRVVAATSLLPGWTGTDLVAGFRTGLGEPTSAVVAVNDVHAHGAGEAWCGAGAGKRDVLLVAVGTGLGGALLHQGVPLTGARGAAGHLGHIASAQAAGLACSCGAIGHLEAVASGYGILQLYRRLGGDEAVADSRTVASRADHDRYADQTIRTAAAALGRGIGDLINVIDPEIVIMSGSVSRAGPTWWEELRAKAQDTALPLIGDTAIVPAILGEDAGVIGAAGLALRTGGGSQ